MSDFERLVADLEGMLNEDTILAKASTSDADDAADDEKIEAAADGDADDDGQDDGEDAVDDYDDDEPMKKSYRVQLDDGTQADALDGNALIKAFGKQIGDLREESRQTLEQIAAALQQSTQLIKSLRTQTQDLRERIDAMSASGRGRKSTLNVHERPIIGDELAKAEAPNPKALMAKALDAQRAGRITGTDVARIDAYLARGSALPDSLLAQIGG